MDNDMILLGAVGILIMLLAFQAYELSGIKTKLVEQNRLAALGQLSSGSSVQSAAQAYQGSYQGSSQASSNGVSDLPSQVGGC